MAMLSGIIAKGLALVDYLLSEWVTMGNPAILSNVCSDNVYVLNASVNACGTAFMDQVVGLVNNGVFLLNQLIMGLFAI